MSLYPAFILSRSLLRTNEWNGDREYFRICKTPEQDQIFQDIAERSKDPNLLMLASSKNGLISLLRPTSEIARTVRAFVKAAGSVIDPEKAVNLILEFGNGCDTGRIQLMWAIIYAKNGVRYRSRPCSDAADIAIFPEANP